MSDQQGSLGPDRFAAATYKEPWTATFWDNLKVYSRQLATAGGAAAIAKTTVAPLERIKVCNRGSSSCHRTSQQWIDDLQADQSPSHRP